MGNRQISIPVEDIEMRNQIVLLLYSSSLETQGDISDKELKAKLRHKTTWMESSFTSTINKETPFEYQHMMSVRDWYNSLDIEAFIANDKLYIKMSCL